MIDSAEARILHSFPEASSPPEARGLERDQVRLMVTSREGSEESTFDRLGRFLRSGDLLVVNRSAVVAASLPASASFGGFRLNLSTDYGHAGWLAEPRWNAAAPGPIPIGPGDTFQAAGLDGQVIASYPGIPRLLFVRLLGDVQAAMRRHGAPIRYGYVPENLPLEMYQTVFGDTPGSAEMPSAARPFSERLVAQLSGQGVEFTSITLHTGVSSLEQGDTMTARIPVYPEPFEVPTSTARTINRARLERRRVIAVGTTVLRALESASSAEGVRGARGFTQAYLNPSRPIRTVNGLITGFHTLESTHMSLLRAMAGPELVTTSYALAARRGFLWHEFGDSQLLLPN